MAKRVFKVGSWIRMKRDEDSVKKGMVGQIKEIGGDGVDLCLGVRFTKAFEDGHDLSGLCANGYGHYVSPSNVTLLAGRP